MHLYLVACRRASPGREEDRPEEDEREEKKVCTKTQIKKERTQRCKWKKGSMHRVSMDLHPTGKELKKKGEEDWLRGKSRSS
jgi:hypothetical protein